MVGPCEIGSGSRMREATDGQPTGAIPWICCPHYLTVTLNLCPSQHLQGEEKPQMQVNFHPRRNCNHAPERSGPGVLPGDVWSGNLHLLRCRMLEFDPEIA